MYKLGNEVFPTKTSIIGYLSKCLQSSKIGESIKEDNDMLWVLKELDYNHPKADEIIGEGIQHFFVGKPVEWPGRCFYLRRKDGSITDFSTKKSINNSPYYPEGSDL
jgi:hypothetical protein